MRMKQKLSNEKRLAQEVADVFDISLERAIGVVKSYVEIYGNRALDLHAVCIYAAKILR